MCSESTLSSATHVHRIDKKAQLTQRERATAVHYEGPLRTNVKSVKTSILVRKVIQGHCFRCQSKPLYEFLLVINYIIVTLALSRTVSEIWPLIGSKSQNFPTPFSFRAIDRGEPYGIFGKALQILKLESLGQPTVKI